ncbi:MAG TPA: AlkA N-terminal domain-containing protein [Acidimicrobiales bacterium]|nr:AlkA N-terminal domain-containing protein [Acidimicrobiales bacterium]
MLEDFERCYRAVQSRDARFDGWFFTAVTSTGIYCRPSCPAMTPKRANVGFYPSAAAAQQAGFRACMRCRPDAAPGSPEWNARADVAARAMRLIGDGAVDREGVAGLAARLGYSERQLHRLLVAEVGTGAIALARAQRAQTARVLIETTDLPAARIAFAAGFSSVRQFNDTVREVFASTPTELRRKHRQRPQGAGAAWPPSTSGNGAGGAGAVALRLAYRQPFDAAAAFGFLGDRAVPGVEAVVDGIFHRSLRLPHGTGTVALAPASGYVAATLRLDDLRDLTAAVSRCRRLLDLDADPVAVDDLLGQDSLLGSLVAAAPGRRVPGTVDGAELAFRAVVGQQVSVAGARTVAGRLVVATGSAMAVPEGPITHLFPAPDELLALPDAALPMPASRRRTIRALATAMVEGELSLDPGADPVDLADRLRAVPGIGDWTAGYVAMRALRDPDAFIATDLGVRRALRWLGGPGSPADVARLADRWRPWRAYAAVHLWSVPDPDATDQPPIDEPKERAA